VVRPLDAGEEEELYPGEKSHISAKSQLSPKEKKKAASFAKLSPKSKEAFQRTASAAKSDGHLRPFEYLCLKDGSGQGHNLALTVLFMPNSLDSGLSCGTTAGSRSGRPSFWPKDEKTASSRPRARKPCNGLHRPLLATVQPTVGRRASTKTLDLGSLDLS